MRVNRLAYTVLLAVMMAGGACRECKADPVIDLATAINNAALGGASYTMTESYTYTTIAGALDGENRDFTVLGQYYTINGGEHKGIQILSGQTLTIEDALVMNFADLTGGNGCAIRSQGDVIFNNSIIGANASASTNLTATINGGGIYVSGGNLTLNDTNMYYNSAIGNKSYGGAIYGRNSNITINALSSDVEFTNNMAENGAAIYNSNANAPVVINATGGNILFENNNNLGEEGGTGTGIYSNGGLTMTAANDKTITINDALSITGTTSVNGGTVKLGQNAATTTFTNFNVAGDTTLDLQNAKAGDNLILATLSGSGELKFNADFNAATGAMDKIVVNNGNGTITLNAIKVLADGTATSADYLAGSARNNITVISDEIISSTDGYRYTFTPSGANGHLLVSREEIGELNLARAIASESLGGTSYTMASDYTFLTNAPALAGANRNFTIFGQNYVIDGGSNNGVTVAYGQTLNVQDVSEYRNFTTALNNAGTLNLQNVTFSNNKTDINNTGNLNLSGTNSINKITGNTGTTTLNGGTTTIYNIAQNRVNMAGGTLKLSTPILGTSVNTLNLENESTLDLQNYYAGDTVTVNTLTGSGELKLKTDYDGTQGTMDKITVNNGEGKVTLNAVRILNDGKATSTDYLDGRARDNVTVITDSMVASTDGYKYTFTPSGSNGHLSVSRQYLGEMDLAHAISDADDGGGSYTMASDFSFNSDAGTLDESGRDFTIFGQNHAINGNDHNGIQVAQGQTLSVENVSEYRDFTTGVNNAGTLNVQNVTFTNNTTDINNTGSVNLSGTNSINTISGTNGQVLISGGKTTIANNG